MTSDEGHPELTRALEAALRDADEPLDCYQLFDMPSIRAVAPNTTRVSNYLGVFFRRGLLTRVRNHGKDPSSRAQWAYLWKDKTLPEWKRPVEVEGYKPRTILHKPNLYINEDGDYINIEMPELTITIRKKPK